MLLDLCVLQCVAECCRVSHFVAECYSVLQCVAVCYSLLQSVAMFCSGLRPCAQQVSIIHFEVTLCKIIPVYFFLHARTHIHNIKIYTHEYMYIYMYIYKYTSMRTNMHHAHSTGNISLKTVKTRLEQLRDKRELREALSPELLHTLSCCIAKESLDVGRDDGGGGGWEGRGGRGGRGQGEGGGRQEEEGGDQGGRSRIVSVGCVRAAGMNVHVCCRVLQ